MDYQILNNIKGPSDLKKLSLGELEQLAQEIRWKILEVVSKRGGHLAPSLGAVELAIAVHYVFDTPRDRVVWDVGHQAYAHKLVTGRGEKFDTLRTYCGISGFPNPSESPFDVFAVGHAGTSVSAALGIKEGLNFSGKDYQVVAVIGDGAMTVGMAFEALNQAGHLKRPLIVILNDNEMAISKNVGALASYMSRKLTGGGGWQFRQKARTLLRSLPAVGEDIYQFAHRIEGSLKTLIYPVTLFEALGFEYIGPIDGHKLPALIEALKNARTMGRATLVHAITRKGKGYLFAERDPTKYHGVGPFDVTTGQSTSKSDVPTYTEVFSNTLVKLAQKNPKILAITAAMPDGTGLDKFREVFPERFYDVGIAEQHAVTFAAGLAREGMRPVAAIYSTFLQRAYDQIVHDVCLQNLPVVFALDRAGLVGEDGPTHHGAFDLSYLRHIPNMVVMSPKDENELQHMIATALTLNQPAAIRYPRGKGVGVSLDANPKPLEVGKAQIIYEGDRLCVLAVGHIFNEAKLAVERLRAEGQSVALVNARFVKPLDEKTILEFAQKTRNVLTVEENASLGGFGSAVAELLLQKGLSGLNFKILGLPDQFVQHGSQRELRELVGLDAQGIYREARKMLPEAKVKSDDASKIKAHDKH